MRSELFDPETSSDSDYFPAAEEIELDEDDERIASEELDDEDEDEEEEEEDENDDDYVNEEDDEGEALERILSQNNPGFLRQIQQVLQHGIRIRTSRSSNYEDPTALRRRRRHLQDLPPIPYKAGKRLLYSGEFGGIDDRSYKKRRYESPKTLTQYARFRELGYRKRESMLSISKKWIPQEGKGRIVVQYDRHVYSGQFSHDGSFFYTASQDFKCRMYQTLNPSDPIDWKLYKVSKIHSPPTSPFPSAKIGVGKTVSWLIIG